jgi:flagellar biosynthesis/type III secretory pathway chaperone
MKDQALKIYHSRALEVWEQFCRLHHDLYELTCDEYQALLSGEIDQLEDLIARKQVIVDQVSHWEMIRSQLIEEMNASQYLDSAIKSASDLILVLRPVEAQLTIAALQNLNDLLIDVISRIQVQNKKNQLFLHRAMQSLNEIKDGFSGKKQFTTYGANGMTRSASR